MHWVADGTRLFGTMEERKRFAATAEAMLVRAQVRYERVSGSWAKREMIVRKLIGLPDRA